MHLRDPGRTGSRWDISYWDISYWDISYWDAAIIEASRTLGCDVVLSEDLSDGQDYAGIRVENPFR